MYLSFDPGDTTGFAEFDERGNVTRKGQVRFDKLVELLESYRGQLITAVVCEDFKVFSHKSSAFKNSRMEVVQALGAIRGFAQSNGAVFVLQSPTIKNIAERWSGFTPRGPHSESHWVDAFNHGVYYLVRQGIRDTMQVAQQKEAKRIEAVNEAEAGD